MNQVEKNNQLNQYIDTLKRVRCRPVDVVGVGGGLAATTLNSVVATDVVVLHDGTMSDGGAITLLVTELATGLSILGIEGQYEDKLLHILRFNKQGQIDLVLEQNLGVLGLIVADAVPDADTLKTEFIASGEALGVLKVQLITQYDPAQ